MQYQFVPHLRRKPITAADAPERKTGKGHNPFLDPNPNEVLSLVGSSHLFLLNKFSVYRPSLLLITRQFVPQTDDLDRDDLAAAWRVLHHFKTRFMMIYNCGAESGSSQGHKHMQFWPYPDKQDLGFDLFPTQVQSDSVVTSDMANVPFKHFVLRIPKDVNTDILVQAYKKLVEQVRRSHRITGGGTDYNVILVKEWMCMIPRRHSGLERGAGAGAGAFVGLVWIVNEAETEVWNASGPAEYLKYLGIPQ